MEITKKKGAELFHPKFSVSRLQSIFHEMRKKLPQSVKLKSSESEYDRPRNNSTPGCHQTDTLLGNMKITQKKGRNCFSPSFQFQDSKLNFMHCAKSVRSP